MGSASAAYPDRPVRFIVPFAPGGGTDIVARIIAQKLNDAWGRPVIVDNRPGAGSTIGTEIAVKAPPDGYTMVLSSISLAFNVTIYMMIAVTAAALPHVKAGKLHALGVTGAERSAVAPGIPTVAEAGVPDYEFKTWYGIQVAAGTPRAIVNRINSDVSRVLKLPEVVDSFVGAGLEPRVGTPEEFASLVRSEIEKWAKVIKASGATIE